MTTSTDGGESHIAEAMDVSGVRKDVKAVTVSRRKVSVYIGQVKQNTFEAETRLTRQHPSKIVAKRTRARYPFFSTSQAPEIQRLR